ncbi:exocyst complex component 6-like isoform X1 [Tachypleus tridentatus]|uniref:exocyst complex component 6-like isoform X1 n=1 Tax=Tachypleus tridentatus TaxID=6853 RepID=UPI003FD2B447
MFPCTPPAESARSNIAYLGMISQCLLIQNLLEGLKKVHFRCALLILDLFITWDWATYFHDYGQENSKYLRVNPQVAVVLLEKVREADKKKNIFSALKKNQRDKKLVETALKQLRQLTSNSD